MDTDKPEILTEEDAAAAYARAWNRFDPAEFCELLAEDAHYASQMVMREMQSKQEISHYLFGKVETIQEAGDWVKAELVEIYGSVQHQIGVFLSRGEIEGFVLDEGIVLFLVRGNEIARVDMCMPGLFRFRQTGIIPK